MSDVSESAPRTLSIEHGSGRLRGATGRYEKRWSDLRGLYLDAEALEDRIAATGDAIAYAVEDHRPSGRAGDLIHGLSVLEPGRVGDEFAMTRGHIHAVHDRPEIYHCRSGRGLMLMERLDGTVAIAEMRPDDVVYVAPHWIHRSVNLGSEPLVTLFCYPADAGQDYGVIEQAGGMRVLITADGRDGWRETPNPRYRPRT